MNRVRRVLTLAAISLFSLQACKTNSKINESAKPKGKKVAKTSVSIISLYDKPLETIKDHVEGQKWQMIQSVGGLTGSDKNSFEALYYTFNSNGKMITEERGNSTEKPYKWKRVRDIYSTDSIYVIATGLVGWKVEGIYKDTLHLADNHPDGYRYSLIKVK